MGRQKQIFKCHKCNRDGFRDNCNLKAHVKICQGPLPIKTLILDQNDIAEMSIIVKQQSNQIKTLTKHSEEVKKVLQVLKKEGQEKEKENKRREAAIVKLQERINKLESGVKDDDKKESFYQEWLAESLDGRHKSVKVGITDLSNALFDMEIKTCKKWKEGLRQIHAYDECTKTGNKVLALFDVQEKYSLDKAAAACKIFNTRLIVLAADKSFRNVFPPDASLGENWRKDVDTLKASLSDCPFTGRT